ncbi:hypothetical protein AFE_1239 [Acidithiobacillus ferrooxidans ATCC 23270]|uniref:Uncharacterized protein n=1 Tax=Acidithiobacillus ferrooxidans (strain ATCC 23270 / DSM 14882 / CIP 104768 / NCIMB 8455) TaxID=243159 RepID=B7J8S1_ACIF2|nr:hypothetical protein AFE_1239 [Acidithiobacillus ferrooxidans ATCC 23270]
MPAGQRAASCIRPAGGLSRYWRSLLDPKLRQLPESILPDQMEEIQAALRDALHLLSGKITNENIGG